MLCECGLCIVCEVCAVCECSMCGVCEYGVLYGESVMNVMCVAFVNVLVLCQ